MGYVMNAPTASPVNGQRPAGTAAHDRRGEEIRPFRIEVPPTVLEDLRSRLVLTRWPEQLPGADWAKGVPVAYLKDLADHWAHGYDWRSVEAQLNEFRSSPPRSTARKCISFMSDRSSRMPPR